jgi:hypothetical protein
LPYHQLLAGFYTIIVTGLAADNDLSSTGRNDTGDRQCIVTANRAISCEPFNSGRDFILAETTNRSLSP